MITKDKIKKISKKLNEPAWLLKRRLGIFESAKNTKADLLSYGINIFADYTKVYFDELIFDGGLTASAGEAKLLNLEEALKHKKYGKLVKEYLLKDSSYLSENKFFAAIGSFAQKTLVLPISKDTPHKERIELSLEQTGQNTLANILVVVEDNVSARLIEKLNFKKNLGISIEVIVGKNSHLTYVAIPESSLNSNAFILRQGRVERDGSLNWHEFNYSAGRVKSSVISNLAGRGAKSKISGGFFGHDSQTCDLYNAINHLAPNTESDILVKGALAETAKTVYRGIIDIKAKALMSAGYLKEETLLLSPKAQIDAIPDLAIANSEVKCGHAVAIAKIDPEKMFYLTARGMDEAEAVKFLTVGHFQSFLGKISEEDLREEMSALISERISLHKINQ